MTCYLNKFAFHECILHFPSCYVFPGVTFSLCSPFQNVRKGFQYTKKSYQSKPCTRVMTEQWLHETNAKPFIFVGAELWEQWSYPPSAARDIFNAKLFLHNVFWEETIEEYCPRANFIYLPQLKRLQLTSKSNTTIAMRRFMKAYGERCSWRLRGVHRVFVLAWADAALLWGLLCSHEAIIALSWLIRAIWNTLILN